MTITKTFKKIGKGIEDVFEETIDVFEATADIFELAIQIIKSLLKLIPELGVIILVILQFVSTAVKMSCSLNKIFSILILLTPYISLLALAMYIGNIKDGEEHKNKMIDEWIENRFYKK